MRSRAASGRRRYAAADAARWPDAVRVFWESGEPERFGVSGAGGDRVDYMRRADGPDVPGVEIYSRDLCGISMEQLSASFARRGGWWTRSMRATSGGVSR